MTTQQLAASATLTTPVVASPAVVYLSDGEVRRTCERCGGRGLVAAPSGDMARYWPCDPCWGGGWLRDDVDWRTEDRGE